MQQLILVIGNAIWWVIEKIGIFYLNCAAEQFEA
jgi:hypothetical protein